MVAISRPSEDNFGVCNTLPICFMYMDDCGEENKETCRFFEMADFNSDEM